MARTETVLQAFVASPKDVNDERVLLEEIIRELNLTWRKTFGLSVELIKWETHAYPDVGNTAQDVINKQIGNEFDIFIGIMWGKFGVSTGKFGSGTEEEFENAHKIYQAGDRKMWIMFYFKDAGIPPSEIDLSQLQSVNSFRSKLGSEGILYWKFQSKDEFSKLLRLHLSRVIQEWLGHNDERKISDAVVPIKQEITAAVAQIDNAEEGYLDFFENISAGSEKVQEVASQLTESMNQIAFKIGARTEELDKVNANKNSPPAVTIQAVRRITDRAAEDINDFAVKIEIEIPIFKKSFETTMDSVIKLVTFQSQSAKTDEGAIDATIAASNLLLATFNQTLSKIAFLRESILKSPNISAKYNASRQKAIKALDRLMEQFATAVRLTQEAQSVFNSLKFNESHP